VTGASQPVFYYDLGSPTCYLAAERIMSRLPVVPEWEPLLGADLGFAEDEPDWEELATMFEAQGLQSLRVPPAWPPDTRLAMLAATYAKRVGRAVAFSLAAFRQAFAGGRDLGDEETVLIAGAACEMHPTALLKGVALRSVGDALEEAGRRALSAGVRVLPAIEAYGLVYEGERAVEEAAGALR
jgi:2-hydroxychromene-2-carboxylate isomerase